MIDKGLRTIRCYGLNKGFRSTFLGIGQMNRVFVNDLGDQGLIPGRVIQKTQKMLLDAAMLNTQHYKVRIKGKAEQSKDWSSTFSYNPV